jgi:hypothetical protein
MGNLSFSIVGFIAFVLFTPPGANAQVYRGTIVHTKGDVKILSKSQSHGQKVIFEGDTYTYKKARVGSRLRPNQVIMTGAEGQAKVTYGNGDQLSIGPGSSLRLPAPEKGNRSKDDGPSLNLFYGKVRAMISKKGPRNRLNVKTRSAVAGVRGTDFFLSHQNNKGTQVTVVRGAVEVQEKVPKSKANKKTVVVKPGYTALVEEAPKTPDRTQTAKKESKVLLQQATKEDFLEIQKTSKVVVKPESLKNLSPEIKQEVQTLNKRTTEVVLEDIKEESMETYKKLKQEKIETAESISTVVVSQLYKKAPRGKAANNPEYKEIETLGEDVYKKYFTE